MPNESSRFVRISWLDREAVRRRLATAVRALVERFPEIERVVLFGSLARGDAVPGSDADLLVVLSDIDLPFLDRSVHYQPDGVGIAVDVFAYTAVEMAAMVAGGSHFLRQARDEGIVLFDRAQT